MLPSFCILVNLWLIQFSVSANPTVFNIGGVLSSNDSEYNFKETIAVKTNIFNRVHDFETKLQHLNFDSQYVPKGVTYYDTAILMDPNPIRTALNVCKYLISSRVRLLRLLKKC